MGRSEPSEWAPGDLVATRRLLGDEEPSTSMGLPSSLSISTRSSRSRRSSRPWPPPPTIESMLKPIFGFEGTGTIGVGASGIIVRLSYVWLTDTSAGLTGSRWPELSPPHRCDRLRRRNSCQTSPGNLSFANTCKLTLFAAH